MLRIAIIVLIVSLHAAPASAHHPDAPPYCTHYSEAHWESGVTEIPIYFSTDPSLPDFVDNDNVPVTDTVQHYSFAIAINEMQERTDLAMRLKFLGSTTSTAIPGAIVILSDPLFAHAQVYDEDLDGEVDKCVLYLPYYGFGEKTFLHELSHCLGFHHTVTEDGCDMDQGSILSPTSNLSTTFREYEIQGLEWAYGRRSSQTHGWVINSTGSSWTPITSYLPFELTRGGLSSCNSLARDGDQVLFTSETANRPQRWDTSVSYSVFVPSSQTWTSAGIACNGAGGYLAAYADQIPGPEIARHFAYSFAGGVGTTTELPTYPNRVPDQIRATYDPATGRYVVVSHRLETPGSNINHVINVEVVGGGARVRLDAASGYVQSRGTANVACGPTSVVGSENCLVAWVGGDWYPTINWIQGHVDPVSLQFVYSETNYRSQGLYVWGGPAVAYTGNPTTPWLLVFHQGGSYLYAYKKSATTSAPWDYNGVVAGPSGIRYTMPTILSYRVLTCGASCFYTNYFRVYTKSWTLP